MRMTDEAIRRLRLHHGDLADVVDSAGVLEAQRMTGVYTLQAIRTHRYAVRKANQRWRPIGANNDDGGYE